jgi:hypothetical protein
MAQETKKYICCRIQSNTRRNLTNALIALSKTHTDECYYNYELADAVHEMSMEIMAMIHEIHEETKCKE